MPMGIPASASFKRYHMEHHRFQGEDVVDVDIPTAAEGAIFTNSPLKVVWCFLQPAFYSLRPMIVNPKEPSFWEVSGVRLNHAKGSVDFQMAPQRRVQCTSNWHRRGRVQGTPYKSTESPQKGWAGVPSADNKYGRG